MTLLPAQCFTGAVLSKLAHKYVFTMKKKISKKLLSPADKRETFIGAKVTAQQKEQIKELAKDRV